VLVSWAGDLDRGVTVAGASSRQVAGIVVRECDVQVTRDAGHGCSTDRMGRCWSGDLALRRGSAWMRAVRVRHPGKRALDIRLGQSDRIDDEHGLGPCDPLELARDDVGPRRFAKLRRQPATSLRESSTVHVVVGAHALDDPEPRPVPSGEPAPHRLRVAHAVDRVDDRAVAEPEACLGEGFGDQRVRTRSSVGCPPRASRIRWGRPRRSEAGFASRSVPRACSSRSPASPRAR